MTFSLVGFKRGRTVLITLSLLFASMVQSAQAQVLVEVSGVAGRAIPISLLPQGGGVENQELVARAANDLLLSGLFEIVQPLQNTAKPYERWGGYAYIAVLETRVDALPDGRWRVTANLHDASQGKELAQFSFQSESTVLLAHKIADAVQEKLTDIAGVSSSRIAYISHANGRYYLYAAYADGGDPVLLVNAKEPLISPVWSPDGNELAYVSFEKGRALIFVQNLQTKTRRTLVQFAGTNSSPAWSPDGKRLAFVSSVDGASNIYMVDANGGDAQALTSGDDIYTEPKFSADGKSLFFTSDRGGTPQIYQMDLATKKDQRLTFEGSYNVSPRPSPDGKYLAYITARDKKYQLFVMNLENKSEFRLSETTADESVAFAPNSKNLMLSTSHSGKRQLLRVSLFGRPSPAIPTISPPSNVAWGPLLP